MNDLIDRVHVAYPDWFLFKFSAGKLGHTVCFAALTLVALLLRERIHVSLLHLALIFMLLALATESIQLFLSSRTPQLKDVWMDLIGVLIGIALFGILALGRSLFGRSAPNDDLDQTANQSASKAPSNV